MEIQTVIDILQDSFWASLFLALPSLLAALIVGVAISIFQSVTSIQEQTLVFVPKMLAVMLALLVTFSWMISKIIHYTTSLYHNIPNFVN